MTRFGKRARPDRAHQSTFGEPRVGGGWRSWPHRITIEVEPDRQNAVSRRGLELGKTTRAGDVTPLERLEDRLVHDPEAFVAGMRRPPLPDVGERRGAKRPAQQGRSAR